MPKRKEQAGDEDEAGDDSDASIIDVDFEFFDPMPDDHLAFKRLLTQLFQADAPMIDVHSLSELIISQPLVGTTVKTDGKESDPLAFLTVLNMRVHKDSPPIRALREYLLSKTAGQAAFQSMLRQLLSAPESSDIGLLLSERLINMPVQVVPPMYKMLANEIGWANDDNEPYGFSHYLIMTRTYRSSPDDEDAMDVEPTPPSKRAKGKKNARAPRGPMTYPFHEEDEQISKLCDYVCDYPFTHSVPREDGAFGLDMGGRVMLLAAGRLSELVNVLEQAYPAPGSE